MLWHWRCVVNGRTVEHELPATTTLLTALREYCGLTGTKGACLEGECGSCTVLLDGEPVNSCLVLAAQAQDRQITTVEGLAEDERLHPIQERFIHAGAAQCGYCTPGLLISAAALLREHPQPTLEQLYAAMEGNICRCTGYKSIREAVMDASDPSAPEARP
jgi:aerobic-type carbon monoxide dehydrogenase small subunit (CoxS/CutS family)